MSSQELEREVKAKEDKMNSYQDALDELEISMEPSVRLMIGESMVELSEEDALQRVEALKEQLQREIDEEKSQVAEMKSEMDSLKSYLYARFGTNINLDE